MNLTVQQSTEVPNFLQNIVIIINFFFKKATWLGRVDFVSGYYACGAQVQVGSYGKYEYLTGIAFAICNGSDWYEQALSVVVEAVSENGTAGQWQTLVQCPVGSYVTGESVLLEKLGPAVAYIGLKLLCDDRNRTWISPYSNYTSNF
jgi:hypothetical protein